MCDFEKASRNAFISIFPGIVIIGCWFHYTKAIYDKVQKLGLCNLFKHNKALKKWVHQLMSLPFLTEEDILPTYLDLELSLSGLTDNELQLVSTFKKYISKNWMNGSENLSVFYYEFSTNNGAESYHKSLNGYIKTNHPNIWKFLSSLNNIMDDYDLEQRRLGNGLEISRPPKLKNRLKKALRNEYKTKYLNSTYTALELVNCILKQLVEKTKRFELM